MNPSAYLALLILLSAAIGTWHFVRRRRVQLELHALAASWGMTYSSGDPLQLTQRIAARFPVAGAAHVSISDLIYGSDEEAFRYYLATEFTVGLLKAKRRVRRVITFTEPRRGESRAFSPMQVAPADLPLIEQFEVLREGKGKAVPERVAVSGD